MKIGIWSDAHKFPNLVAMKLSAYHKAYGTVEHLEHLTHCDILYLGKVFNFTSDAKDSARINAEKIVRGGTGYNDFKSVLLPEIEHIYPDYSFYP